MSTTPTATFDKPSYNVGDPITLTVIDPTLVGATETENASYTEADGDAVTQVTTIKHPGAAVGVLTSSTGRVYTLVSQTGATLIYTAKA